MMKRRCLVVLGLLIAPVAFGNRLGDMKVPKTAEQFVAEFHRGMDLKENDSLDGIVVNHRIDKSSLFILARELATGTSETREKIAELIGKLGLKLDQPGPEEFPVIRDHAVIRILLVEGFAKDDSAANASELILRKKCMQSDLAVFSEIFIKSLQKNKGEYLYLIAKAKSAQTKPMVESLARSEVWKEQDDRRHIIKIAQAALGNTAIEDEFITATLEAEKNAPPAPKNRFYDVGNARDGREVAELLGTLGLIGTTRSLQVICKYLRSPLKSYVRDIKERSIRYDALEAIRYNFPNERALYRPKSVVEWAAAEKFCIANLGAVFQGPTPDLPPDQPYPTRQP